MATRIQSGAAGLDAALAGEIAGLLADMADAVEAQRSNFSGIERALKYYSEPDLYHKGVALDDVILDGGLRARRALGLVQRTTAATPLSTSQGAAS